MLRPHDLDWAVNKLPKIVRTAMKTDGGKLILAGGYIRSRVSAEKPHDIDLFCPSKEDAERIAKNLCGDDGKLITTDNAFTVLNVTECPIQVIHRWTYSDPMEVIQSFDFTIAQAAIWYDPGSDETQKHWTSHVHQDFYADLCGKRLVYTSPQRNEDAGGSMLRVLKFYQRGFRIPLWSLGAVVARLVNGVDQYNDILPEDRSAELLSGLLREVDPSIDPEHLGH